MVGLPERSDKKDATTLAASLTDIDLEWIDGVDGASIPEKALPYGEAVHRMKTTHLGCWRGHMNAIRA